MMVSKNITTVYASIFRRQHTTIHHIFSCDYQRLCHYFRTKAKGKHEVDKKSTTRVAALIRQIKVSIL